MYIGGLHNVRVFVLDQRWRCCSRRVYPHTPVYSP